MLFMTKLNYKILKSNNNEHHNPEALKQYDPKIQ